MLYYLVTALYVFACLVLLPVNWHRWLDMLVHEGLHTIEPFALTVRHVEVHWAFLTFFAKIFGGTVSPPSLVRKTNLAAERSGRDDGRRAGNILRHRRIDIPLSQTLVSYNRLKCNAGVA